MKKTYTSVYLSILFTLLLSFVSVVPLSILNAQSDAITQPSIELPSVALNSLIMDEYIYTPGKELKMTLDIENISSSPSEFRYKVEILSTDPSLQSTSTAQTILSASKFSERYVLRPKEAKRIDISYVIPSYAKGTVVLKVSAVNDAGFEVYSKTLSLLDSRQENSGTKTASSASSPLNNSIGVSSSLEIKKIVFQQGKSIFEPKGDGSSYLLDKTVDLNIEVTTDGRTEENALILAELHNTHTGSTTEAVQGVNSRGKSIAQMQLKTMLLPPGVYELTLTPINPEKKQIGPSKKINVGIEGIVAVVQSLNLSAKLPVKKGDTMYLSAYWVPLMQISKELTEDLNADSKFNKPFTAKIFIEDEKGNQISSSTINGASPEIFTELKAETSANNVFGRIEIWIESEMIGSYEKELQLEPLVGGVESNKMGLWDYVLTALLLVLLIAVIVFIRKKKIKMQSVSTFMLLISIIVPQLTFAQWTQFSTSASLTHLFPKDPYGDLSTTTWRQVNGASGGYNPNWPLIVPYSRSNCTVRTAATGASSNYVAQTLPSISGNNKMYRWEHALHKNVQGGNIWYWIDKNTYFGNWPQTGVIPGIFSRSAFIHESILDRSAAYSDPLSSTDGAWSWAAKRPIRINAANGMGTNVVSALATTTYSNLTQWVNAWFNVFESKPPAYGRYFEYFGDYGIAEAEFLGLFAADVAIPAEELAEDYELGFTSTNLSARKTALGVTGNSNTIFSVDAGGFYKNMNSAMFDNDYTPIEKESLAGTYRLFDFLYTARDEADITLVTGKPQYNCFSANLQVWQNNYEVIGNSYLDVVLFYDENEDGIKQETEYPIADQSVVDGGTTVQNYNGGIYNTSCNIVPAVSENLYAPNFYKGTPSNPIHFFNASAPGLGGKYFPVTVRSSAQVTPLAYIESNQFNQSMAWYPSWDPAGYGQVYNWAKNSLLWNTVAKYDTQGRLIATTTVNSQVCGHTLTSYYDSSWRDKAYEVEIRDYPVPESIANESTVYWKIPINSEISTSYVVSMDKALFPTGWATTTAATTTTVAAGSQNQHIPIYFGVKYTADGVCGTATTTTGTAPTAVPSTNLCSIGTASAVDPEVQRSTWTCFGIGGGSDAQCIKQKCGPTNPYYCATTNTCVIDQNACVINGVCGYSDVADGQTQADNPPQPPNSLFCDAGNETPVTGEGEPHNVYTWTCQGINGGTTASCDQPKCSNGLVYCAVDNVCLESCPVVGPLITNTSLAPKIVRRSTDQCIFSWQTPASADTLVSCTLNGVGLGHDPETIQRSTPVSVGNHTLSCTSGGQTQSTTTKCLLNPSYREI